MTHDTTNPNPPTPLEPELEARLVAWIAGEVSEAEQAELQRIVAERPAAAEFKRQMEQVGTVLGDALRADAAPLRLPAERRARLLETLALPSEAPATPEHVVELPPRPAWWSGRTSRIYFAWAGAAAACVVVMLQIARQEPFDLRTRDTYPDPAPASVAYAPQIVDVSLPPVSEPQSAVEAEGRMNAPAVTRVELPRARDESLVRSNIETGIASRERARDVEVAMREAKARSVAASGTLFPAPPSPSSPPASIADDVKKTSALTLGADAPAPPGDFFRIPGVALGGATPLPSTVPPAQTSFGFTGGKAVANANAPVLTENGNFDRRNAVPATADPDGVIKLDAFIVSSERSGSALASLDGAARGIVASSALGASRLAVIPNPLNEQAKEDAPAARGGRMPPPVTGEIGASAEPVSTFSLHVSDVSFRLAQAALARGAMPDANGIRAEEFYNAFHYGDPVPAAAEKVGVRIEQAAHPFRQQRNLVRIALKVPATGRTASQPLRLTVLLDTSGSMERDDRAATVRRALEVLVSLLRPDDRLTLIGFARQPRLIADGLAGDKASQVLNLASAIPAEGGTNLEAALELGAELALRHRLAGAQNRIVVLTDGAANLGNANPIELARKVDALRQNGIAFDACGVGLDGLDDTVLEALTRKGDGRYYVLDSPEAADAGFARQLAGAFRPAAENVKLQVRFNPARVGQYRLIGFEQHRLRTEDFRNDRVDAAELAAEEAAVALYQVEVLPQGTGELGDVFVRFRDAATGSMVERSWTIPHDANARAFEHAAPSLQLAGAAALLAEKLRGGPVGEPIKLRDLAGVVSGLRVHYPHQPRVEELIAMFAQVRRLGFE